MRVIVPAPKQSRSRCRFDNMTKHYRIIRHRSIRRTTKARTIAIARSAQEVSSLLASIN